MCKNCCFTCFCFSFSISFWHFCQKKKGKCQSGKIAERDHSEQQRQEYFCMLIACPSDLLCVPSVISNQRFHSLPVCPYKGEKRTSTGLSVHRWENLQYTANLVDLICFFFFYIFLCSCYIGTYIRYHHTHALFCFFLLGLLQTPCFDVFNRECASSCTIFLV